jgi:hypothetical protein
MSAAWALTAVPINAAAVKIFFMVDPDLNRPEEYLFGGSKSVVRRPQWAIIADGGWFKNCAK